MYPALVKSAKVLPKNFDRILLIQLGDIGDVVLTLPAIMALRNTYPQSRIVFCIRKKVEDLVQDWPWINRVVVVEKEKRGWLDSFIHQVRFFRNLRKDHFDLVVDLRTGTRGAALAILSGSRVRIGRFADDGHLWRNRLFTHLVRPEPNLELEQYAAEHALNILAPLQLKREAASPLLSIPAARSEKTDALLRRYLVPLQRSLVAVHPFSLWKYKEWSGDKWVRLIRHIRKKYNASVIITGGPEDARNAAMMSAESGAGVYNLAGKTQLGDLPGIYRACRLFIGVDTAALHIAAVVGTPTLGIFGPSSPATWAPRGPQHGVIMKRLPCVPCRQKGCQDMETSRCLDELTFDEARDMIDCHLQNGYLNHAQRESSPNFKPGKSYGV